MEKFLQTPFTHHAYLLIGEREKLLSQARELIQNNGENNFAVEEYNFDMLTIDEARELRASLSLMPNDTRERLIFASFGGVNYEAVQTILKMVEEPGDKTRFFFFASPYVQFPDTFLSRFTIYKDIHRVETYVAEAKSFLKASSSERIVIIEKMNAKKKKNKEESVFRAEALLLVDALEQYMYEKMKNGSVSADSMRKLLETKSYLRDRGAMTKMLLESLALTIPSTD